MKKSSILLLGLLVVAIVVVATMVARYLLGVVPYWQCSEVYKKYSRVEGVRATYVKDYRVNDTLTVGVTLLEATDSAGWERLSRDFEIPELGKEDEQNVLEHSTVGFKKMCPQLPKDDTENWLTTYSREKRSVCVFHVVDNAQYLAIIMYSLDVITESK